MRANWVLVSVANSIQILSNQSFISFPLIQFFSWTWTSYKVEIWYLGKVFFLFKISKINSLVPSVIKITPSKTEVIFFMITYLDCDCLSSFLFKKLLLGTSNEFWLCPISHRNFLGLPFRHCNHVWSNDTPVWFLGL